MNEDVEARSTGADRWVEALTWHDTLRNAADRNLTDGLAREWQHWYSDAENQRIFDNVSRLLARPTRYRRRSLPGRKELDADDYDLSVPIAEWRQAHAPELMQNGRPASGNRWLRLSGGLVAVATIAAIVVFAILGRRGTGSPRR